MKKVTMFVWNHFTNDARVNRECTALSEKYKVHLIAIHDAKDKLMKKYEQRNRNFSLNRVKRYPLLIELFQKDKKAFVIKFGTVATLISIPLLYISLKSFLIYIIALICALVLFKMQKVRKHFVNSLIMMRMIKEGYKQNADIYHSNDLNTLPQGVICSKLRLKPRKLVYDSHEVQTSRTGYNGEKIKKIERFLLQFVDEMIVENHTRAKHNESLYGFYPYTLYNYSELFDINTRHKVDLHKQLNLPKDEKILLYQGGIQQGRGLENLVDMMQYVDEGTLVFIGNGKLEKTLKEKASKSPAADRIKFIDKVPFEQLPSYTKNAYLGFQVLQNICFNHYSASSNKLFEYIMAHVPVISCDFPEIKNVVDQGVGLSVDSSDVQSIAHAVNSLIKDEVLRNKMSEQCKEIKLKYNWEVEKEKLFKVYKNVESIEPIHFNNNLIFKGDGFNG